MGGQRKSKNVEGIQKLERHQITRRQTKNSVKKQDIEIIERSQKIEERKKFVRH